MTTEEQLEIMHALQEAPRAPWAVLGSVLGADPRAVARDYKSLVESGMMRLIATPGPRLLERLQFGHLRLRAAPGRAETVAAGLAYWPQATTVRVTDGSFDVHALVVGTDARTLLRSVHEAVAALPDVEAAEVSTVLRTIDVGRAGRLDSLSPAQVQKLRATRLASGSGTPSRLGIRDFDLMRALTADGRMEISELARELGREPSTVSRRVARLQTDGYLDFLALTTDTASSFPVVAYLWCIVDAVELEALITRLPIQPWLGSFTVTSGRSNVCVVAHLQTPAGLLRIMEQLTALSPSLRVTETQITSPAVKLHTRLLDEHDRFTDDICDPYTTLAPQLIARVGNG